MPKRKVGGGVSDHEDDDEEVPASKKKSNSGDADSVVACEVTCPPSFPNLLSIVSQYVSSVVNSRFLVCKGHC